MILFFIGLLAGAMKALRDTIAHHWDRSIFSKIKNDKIRKWFESKYENRPKLPEILSFLWDGWHFGDFFSYALLFIGMGIFCLLFNILFILNIILCIIGFISGFQVCYKVLFLSESWEND